MSQRPSPYDQQYMRQQMQTGMQQQMQPGGMSTYPPAWQGGDAESMQKRQMMQQPNQNALQNANQNAEFMRRSEGGGLAPLPTSAPKVPGTIAGPNDGSGGQFNLPPSLVKPMPGVTNDLQPTYPTLPPLPGVDDAHMKYQLQNPYQNQLGSTFNPDPYGGKLGTGELFTSYGPSTGINGGGWYG